MLRPIYSYTIGLLAKIQEVFHVYLTKFENAITHLFLIILSIGESDLQEYAVIKKTFLYFYFLV